MINIMGRCAFDLFYNGSGGVFGMKQKETMNMVGGAIDDIEGATDTVELLSDIGMQPSFNLGGDEVFLLFGSENHMYPYFVESRCHDAGVKVLKKL